MMTAMKKLLYIIPALVLMLSSCNGFFELDNHESYNAQITGKFTEADGTPIQMESYDVSDYIWVIPGVWGYEVNGPQAGYIQAYELGWDSEAAQNWFVKFDGTYTNNLVFAGKYRLDFSKLPVYPLEKAPEVEIKKGANTFDFQMVPYARVKNVEITFVDGKFKITCNPESSNIEKINGINEVKVMVGTDKFICTATNNIKDDTAVISGGWGLLPSGAQQTLYVDPSNIANEAQFKYERAHYFRVGVKAQKQDWTNPANNINNDGLYNYSEIFKVTPTYSGGKITGIASVEKVTF